jgi:rare lipoprotein A
MKSWKITSGLLTASLTLGSLCTPVLAETIGKASYYGKGFHGRLAANGERFNMHAMTAAHRSLPFGTRLQVTNMKNGRSVVVRISDRGPYVRGRILDLSLGAAQAIGMVHSGVEKVKVTNLGVLPPRKVAEAMSGTAKR